MLDFSGYDSLSQFQFDDVEFQCDGVASGIMLARQGLTFHLRDCFITRPKDRGLTSIGSGCQGMLIDRCQFLSSEQPLGAEERRSIGFNSNANDVKLRNNRAVMFRHFAVIGGSGSIISGNHWFQGDTLPNGVRLGGMVFTSPNPSTLVTGNYIDNNFIEWTNEHDATPALGQQFSFGGMTLTGNLFFASNVAPWFNWIVIKPYGPGHFIHGLSVTGNVFRTINGFIDGVERVDTSFAGLDFNRMRNVSFEGNVFHGVQDEARNPLSITHEQASAAQGWVIETAPRLPFGGWARVVEAVVPVGRIADAGGAAVFDAPWVEREFGPARQQIRLNFRNPCTGEMRCRIRMDNPL